MEQRIPAYFEMLDGEGGVRLKRKIGHGLDLAAVSRTPFVFYEKNELDNSLELFQRYLPEVGVCYAIKSNSDPFLLESLIKQGISFDVASGGEIEIMARKGVPGERMILAHPIKSFATICSAIKHQVKAYTFDNRDELLKLRGYFDQMNPDFQPASILRIETRSNGVQVDLSEKFGAAFSDALDLLALAKELSLNPIGISFHVGCQSSDLRNFEMAIADVLEIFQKARNELGLNLSLIDIGGGFPIDCLLGRGTMGLEGFFAGLKELLAPLKDYQVIAEPGRIISGPAGTIVTSIVGKASRRGKNWLYLDDGVYGCYSGILCDHAVFSYIPTDPKFQDEGYRQKLVPYVLAGPTCDSIDVLAREVYLPEDINIGDQLLTCDIGAYSMASATDFNGFSPRRFFYYDQNDQLDQSCSHDRRQPILNISK